MWLALRRLGECCFICVLFFLFPFFFDFLLLCMLFVSPEFVCLPRVLHDLALCVAAQQHHATQYADAVDSTHHAYEQVPSLGLGSQTENEANEEIQR